MLSLGRVLQVPLRKPCTRCPVPPDVIVPARKLPPGWGEAVPAPPPAVVEMPEWNESWERSVGAF
jgi:hypothetical protein